MFFKFLAAHSHELMIKSFEQLYLVVLSAGAAVIIGVCLGVLVSRVRKLKTAVFGFANVLQTIPSIALLGFLLPVFGIGAKPTLIALTLYALLPIIRNTVIGLESVPKNSLDAARAIGFTNFQRLWIVELPLALPVIVAGIRTAAVICVGIATIAAFIGAGGLGDFIFEGLSLNNTNLILLGAVPAALMALVFDLGIGYIEKCLSYENKEKKLYRKRYIFYFLFFIILCAAAINKQSLIKAWFEKKPDTVVVASKNFTEQYILGELMAQMITAKTHLKVIRKFNLGTTAICHQALLRGDIDIYPEYTGTAYLLILKRHYKKMSSKKLYNIVKNAYFSRYHILWLSPFGFNNTQTIALRRKFAKIHHLKMISDLRNIENQLIIGAPPEFLKRPDAFLGLKKVYGLKFAEIKSLSPDLMYEAIKNKSVNVIPAFSTDGRIQAYHLVTMRDNKNLYPSYYAAPLIRQTVLKKHPEILKALKPLAGIINSKLMRRLNYEVNVEKHSPKFVAHQFLLGKGVI